MDVTNAIDKMLGTGRPKTNSKLPDNQQMAKDMGIKLITVDRKLRLGDGRIVDGKLKGQNGGDVFEIKVKVGNKYVNPRMLKGKVFPISSVGKTPFIDI